MGAMRVATDRTLTRKALQTYARARLPYHYHERPNGLIVAPSAFWGVYVRIRRNGLIVLPGVPTLKGIALVILTCGLAWFLYGSRARELAREIFDRVNRDLGSARKR